MAKRISPEEAYKIMQNSPQALIIDVREREEFASGHIANAKNISLNSITKAEQLITDKSVMLLVYCYSGKRSAAAAAALTEMGYTSVYDFGGIVSWKQKIEK